MFSLKLFVYGRNCSHICTHLQKHRLLLVKENKFTILFHTIPDLHALSTDKMPPNIYPNPKLVKKISCGRSKVSRAHRVRFRPVGTGRGAKRFKNHLVTLYLTWHMTKEMKMRSTYFCFYPAERIKQACSTFMKMTTTQARLQRQTSIEFSMTVILK